MGLTRQYETGLDLGCVKCKILLHRYRSCRDPGFASATCAAKTGIRRVDIVFQRGFEDGLTCGEFDGVIRAGQRDGHFGLGKVIDVCGPVRSAEQFEVYPLGRNPLDVRSSRIVVTRSLGPHRNHRSIEVRSLASSR